MSHNIHHSVYPENVKKERVQAEWDEYAAREDWQEGCSGLASNIQWKSRICYDEAEAYAYLEKIDSGWYDQLAVRFYDYPKLKPSKTSDTLKERMERLTSRYHELQDAIHYKGVKSQLVTCRECGSKIATKYIGVKVNNICPVCHSDMRPESILELIEKAKQNASKAKKDYEAEVKKLQEKQKKKAVLKWLVKIEYHT